MRKLNVLKDGGFSLSEMLVAVAGFGILMVALASSLALQSQQLGKFRVSDEILMFNREVAVRLNNPGFCRPAAGDPAIKLLSLPAVGGTTNVAIDPVGLNPSVYVQAGDLVPEYPNLKILSLQLERMAAQPAKAGHAVITGVVTIQVGDRNATSALKYDLAHIAIEYDTADKKARHQIISATF